MTRENILPREDILRMSREAGLNMGTIQQYERFTQLIANALAALQSAALREELAKPDHIPDVGKLVGPEPVAQRELIKELADQYARECVEFAKAIPSGAHSMSPIAIKSGDTRLSLHTAIDAMTAAAQPAQQEPVLFIHPSTLEMANAHVGAWKPGHELPGYTALYATLPQRQPLTEQEIANALIPVRMTGAGYYVRLARAIEAAHDIKEKV